MAHGDYTGGRKADLAVKYANEQKLAASQMSLVSQVVAENRNEVIDLFSDVDYENLEARREDEDEEGVVHVGASDDFIAQFQPVKFRASETVEQVTIGKDRLYNLQEGQIYKAPRWVVEHLDEKRLVRH